MSRSIQHRCTYIKTRILLAISTRCLNQDNHCESARTSRELNHRPRQLRDPSLHIQKNCVRAYRSYFNIVFRQICVKGRYTGVGPIESIDIPALRHIAVQRPLHSQNILADSLFQLFMPGRIRDGRACMKNGYNRGYYQVKRSNSCARHPQMRIVSSRCLKASSSHCQDTA